MHAEESKHMVKGVEELVLVVVLRRGTVPLCLCMQR